MSKGYEKFIKHFIDKEEYSPGLFINIVSVKIDDDKVHVKFNINNVENVPYHLLVVGMNLKEKIVKSLDYLSLEDVDVVVGYQDDKYNCDNILSIFSSGMPDNEIFYITQSFKSKLLENLQDINKLPVSFHHGEKDNLDVLGKFIPKITIDDVRDEIYLNLTFRVTGTNPKIKYDLEQLDSDVDVALTDIEFEEYNDIRDAVSETMDEWPSNFFIENYDDVPYWLEEIFHLKITLV